MSEAATDALTASVIIPAFGRPELLEAALRSLLAQDFDPDRYEVIVVDSSPDDSNVRIVEKLQPQARCALRCLTKKREGPGPSRNLGARRGRGRVLAFMDSDCQAAPAWLRAGVDAFDEGVGLVQGRTIPDPDVPHSVFNRSIRIEEEGFIYEGGNMFYAREAFEQAGGFSDNRGPDLLWREDVSLAWTVKGNGWQSRFAHGALVVHIVRRVSTWRWLCDKHMFVIPGVARDFPEIRRFFFARYFFDHVQAALVLALAGAALAVLHPVALLLALPYALIRGSEPTHAMRGPRRVLRVLVYLPRDLITLGLLTVGSLRYRALLL